MRTVFVVLPVEPDKQTVEQMQGVSCVRATFAKAAEVAKRLKPVVILEISMGAEPGALSVDRWEMS